MDGPGGKAGIHDLRIIPLNLLHLLPNPIAWGVLVDHLTGIPGLLPGTVYDRCCSQYQDYSHAQLRGCAYQAVDNATPVVLFALDLGLTYDFLELDLSFANVVVFVVHVVGALYGRLVAR